MVRVGVHGTQTQLFTSEDFDQVVVHIGKVGVPLYVESPKEGLLKRGIGREHLVEQFSKRQRREVVRQGYPEPVLDRHLA